jgi:hypothetical protein
MLWLSRVSAAEQPVARLVQVLLSYAAWFGKRTVANPPVWPIDSLYASRQ